MMIEGSGPRIQSRIRIHTSDQWIRIREAQNHVDAVDPDPDPQHCLKASIFFVDYKCTYSEKRFIVWHTYMYTFVV